MKKLTRRFLKLLLFMTLYFPIVGHGADMCTEVAQVHCTQGRVDDSTGIAWNPTPGDNRADTIRTGAEKSLKEKLRAALKNPANARFREAAMNGSGLSGDPDCRSDVERLREPCFSRLFEASSKIAWQELLPASRERVHEPEINPDEVDAAENQCPVPPPPGTDSHVHDHHGHGQAHAQNEEARGPERALLGAPELKRINEEVLREVQRAVGAGELDKKIRRLFPEVKSALIEKLKKLVPDEAARNKMIAKIKSVSFGGTNCGPGVVSGALEANAFYLRHENTVKVCSGSALQNTSDFQLISTIAHELSHSIDPCEIAGGARKELRFSNGDGQTREESDRQYPIPGLLTCLRGSDSAGAMTSPPRYCGVDPSTNPPRPLPHKHYCDGDQIRETFAEWLGYEGLAEFMNQHHATLSKQNFRKGVGNVYRGLCGVEDNASGAPDVPYPPRRQLLNNMLLVQPEIRSRMGCSVKPPKGRRYCGPEELNRPTSQRNSNGMRSGPAVQ